MRPRELAAATKFSVYVLRRRLDDLAAAGRVILTGSTRNRQVSLGHARATTKSAQPVSIHMDSTPTSKRDADQRLPSASSASAPQRAEAAVEARDRAILAFLKEGSASFQAVVNAVPAEPEWTNGQRAEACTLALRRLRLKQLVVMAGDTWMLPMASR